jgi:hypothetical protein
MSLAETLLVGALGGLLTGGVAIVGVLVAAGKASTAAAQSDERRAAAATAADERRAAAEHQRWSRDQRLAAYADCLAEIGAWIDLTSERALARGVAGIRVSSVADLFSAARSAKRSYNLLKLLASADVDRAAGELLSRSVALSRLSTKSPAPEKTVITEAMRACAAANNRLLGAIQRELDLAPPYLPRSDSSVG